MSQRTAVMAATSVVVYAAMWIGWTQSWPWLNAFDNWSLDGLYSLGAGHPAWVTCWNTFCTVLGPTTFRAFGVGVIIWLLLRGYLRAALFLVVSVELAGLVSDVAKFLANRPRPSTAMVGAAGSAFPSGHAVGVTAAVLALLTVASAFLTPRWRVALIVIGAAVIVTIGFGRVALNVHHPSDVLAGWALGFLWYLASVLVLRPLPLTSVGVSAAAGKPATPDNES